MSEFSIVVDKLRREFKVDRNPFNGNSNILVALDDVNLNVKRGELFGLLGPNGAGKTTTIRILATLMTPTSGRCLIEGLDIQKDLNKVRYIINMVSGGESCGYGILSAVENLRLFTEIYGIPWKVAKPRVERMLDVVGLSEKKNVLVNKLSTGMRQRINFARGFTTNPKVLFLDEPTVGMDVHAARDIREFVSQWMKENPDCTILLTTHYMAEADEMCDRVAIIDRGKVQACDTPEALKKMVQKETILDLTISGEQDPTSELKNLDGVKNISSEADMSSQTLKIRAMLDSPEASGNLLRVISSNGRRLLGLHSVEPTLEDVFVKITGRSLREASQSDEK